MSASPRLGKTELVERLHERTGLPHRLLREVVGATLDVVRRSLLADREVSLQGTATLYVEERPPMVGYDPDADGPIELGPAPVLRARLHPSFKDIWYEVWAPR